MHVGRNRVGDIGRALDLRRSLELWPRLFLDARGHLAGGYATTLASWIDDSYAGLPLGTSRGAGLGVAVHGIGDYGQKQHRGRFTKHEFAIRIPRRQFS